MNRFLKSMLLAALGLTAIFSTPAKASQNYQRTNGVAGEFKNIKVCSYDYNYTISGSMEASNEGREVQNVVINSNLKRWISPTPNGWSVPLWTQTGWRQVQTRFNFPGVNRRFYNFEYSSSYGTLLAFDQDVVIGNSILTYATSNSGQQRTYDLGGTINMGMIQKGTCKVYDDGNFR
jgi:hypothetical protein